MNMIKSSLVFGNKPKQGYSQDIELWRHTFGSNICYIHNHVLKTWRNLNVMAANSARKQLMQPWVLEITGGLLNGTCYLILCTVNLYLSDFNSASYIYSIIFLCIPLLHTFVIKLVLYLSQTIECVNQSLRCKPLRRRSEPYTNIRHKVIVLTQRYVFVYEP